MKTLKIKCRIQPLGDYKYNMITQVKGYLNKDVLIHVIKAIIKTGQDVYGPSFARLVQSEIGASHD